MEVMLKAWERMKLPREWMWVRRLESLGTPASGTFQGKASRPSKEKELRRENFRNGEAAR